MFEGVARKILREGLGNPQRKCLVLLTFITNICDLLSVILILHSFSWGLKIFVLLDGVLIYQVGDRPLQPLDFPSVFVSNQKQKLDNKKIN